MSFHRIPVNFGSNIKDYSCKITYNLLPSDIRKLNKTTVEGTLKHPPSNVLSFGQRKGTTWEKFNIELCNLLEKSNCLKNPTKIEEKDIFLCAQKANGF